jgi:DNA-binding HxlR family transcriptional regulator
MPKVTRTMPKRRVRGSRTGRPIMALLDLLGRRWTLRIMWELRDGALTSRALRTACDEASPTVLNQRLKELREAGFVELGDAGGYGLTPLGRELNARSLPLYHFAEKWRGRQVLPCVTFKPPPR